MIRKEKIIKSIDAKIKTLLQKMENLRERYVNGFVDEDEYLYLIVPLDKNFVNLKKEKKKLEEQVDNKLQYSNMINDADKYEYINNYIDHITVDLNKKKVVEVVIKK